jgi:hypothetical protein
MYLIGIKYMRRVPVPQLSMPQPYLKILLLWICIKNRADLDADEIIFFLFSSPVVHRSL